VVTGPQSAPRTMHHQLNLFVLFLLDGNNYTCCCFFLFANNALLFHHSSHICLLETERYVNEDYILWRFFVRTMSLWRLILNYNEILMSETLCVMIDPLWSFIWYYAN
jgi:hypothetical protein